MSRTREILRRRLAGLWVDDHGGMSLLSVFGVLMLATLLAWTMNVARHVDRRIRMQNAADAAAQSSGTVLARSMNTLAFTNHLLCEVFAWTAFMREATNRNAEHYLTQPGGSTSDSAGSSGGSGAGGASPSIHDAWVDAGRILERTNYDLFEPLGELIPDKIGAERDAVIAHGDWFEDYFTPILPVFESIIETEAIPRFQRDVVLATPDLAASAAREAGRLHGEGDVRVALWRLSGPIARIDEAPDPLIPVADPMQDTVYQNWGREWRKRYTKRYLDDWNQASLGYFIDSAKMSQFYNLWCNFTHGYLNELLSQNVNTNLPMMIITDSPGQEDTQYRPTVSVLERDYMFLAVCYAQHDREVFPTLFRNPIEETGNDGAVNAFAQILLYVPEPRLVWNQYTTGGGSSGRFFGSGIGGGIGWGESSGEASGETVIVPGRQPGRSRQWNLANQNWQAKLVPATHRNVTTILAETHTELSGKDEAVRLITSH